MNRFAKNWKNWALLSIICLGQNYSESSSAIDPDATATEVSTDSNPPSGHVCTRPDVGSAVTHKTFLSYFDNSAAGDYLLTRLPSVDGADRYEIVLNYQFDTNDAGVIPFVNKCFARMSPYLIGPNGEQINLRLPVASDKIVPHAHPVTVSPACGDRGEALCWTENYDCATVLHETMHHLGLVDEYLDYRTKCRSGGPLDSLMTNPVVARQAISPVFTLNFTKCDIFRGKDHDSCMHALDLIESGMSYKPAKEIGYYSYRFENGEVLPLYFETLQKTAEQELKIGGGLIPAAPIVFNHLGVVIPDETIDSFLAAAEKYAKISRTDPEAVFQITLAPGKRKSILYPAEISTLIYGNCSINETFMACSRAAYSGGFCGRKPSVCPHNVQSDAWANLPDGILP
jgi:hypothetical protein